MQLSITASLQQTQFSSSQLLLGQSVTTTAPQSAASPGDQVEISDEARHPRNGEHRAEGVARGHFGRHDTQFFSFLKGMLEQITGAQVNVIQGASAATAPAAPTAAQDSQTSVSAQEASVSFETSSLSVDGTITTADGANLAFSLDMQVTHASATADAISLSSGQNGYNFSFAGSAAELFSSDFSFSLTAVAPDGTSSTGNGSGTFSLKDDLKEVRHILKPLLKEFLKDAGMPADRSSVNQLLSTIA